MSRTILASVISVFLFAVPVVAAEPTGTATDAVVTGATAVVPVATGSLASAAAAEAVNTTLGTPAPAPVGYDWWRSQNHRPAALSAMYVSTALLQAFDAYSTMKALHLGGVEANPFMKSATANTAAFLGVKAAVTAASIMSAERMWKRHNRTGAIVTMAVTNGFMAWVAAHNAGVVSGLQR